MITLAIDTSGEGQLLGLQMGDTLVEKFEVAGRDHARIILPSILALLDEAGIAKSDVDLLVFGRGPGSFTGLRIAVGVVQGLAFGLGIPVVGVSTLACLAQGEYRRSGARQIVVAQSARKTEVFYGSYRIEDGLAVLQGEEGVFEASQVPSPGFDSYTGVGSGWTLRAELEAALGAPADEVVLAPELAAADLLALGLAARARGEVQDALHARPEYLREKVAAKPGEPPS